MVREERKHVFIYNLKMVCKMFLKIFFYVDKAQKTEMEKREKERKDRTKVNKNSNYCTRTLPSSFTVEIFLEHLLIYSRIHVGILYANAHFSEIRTFVFFLFFFRLNLWQGQRKQGLMLDQVRFLPVF